MDLQQKLQVVQNFILGTFGDTLKPASGCLVHPYISPGGPYAVQLWDWDYILFYFGLIPFVQVC